MAGAPLLAHIYEDEIHYQEVPERSSRKSNRENVIHVEGAAHDIQSLHGWSFYNVLLRQLPEFLRVARPWHGLSLAALSVLEAYIVSRSGRVAGTFYRVLVDRDAGGLVRAAWLATALYALTSLVQAMSHWLSEIVAASGRQNISSWMHLSYCKGAAFATLPASVDNPDQRIASDAQLWSEQLGALAPIFAAAPLKVLFYTQWMTKLTSVPAVAATYVFFAISSLLQWTLFAPIAAAVFKQERLEGDFRGAHARLRAHATDSSLSNGSIAEQASLDGRLMAAVANQRRLAAWHGLQQGLTRFLDYGGALIAYCSVGLAIFAEPVREEEPGRAAERISNACFAALMLINSFSQMLDASQRLSTLAGLTCRLHQLSEGLRQLQPSTWMSSKVTDSFEKAYPFQNAPGKAYTTEWAVMLAVPQEQNIPGGGTLEASVHRLGPQGRLKAAAAMEDAPVGRSLLAVSTFQFAARDIPKCATEANACDDSPAAAQIAWQSEMDRMLDCFVKWATAVRQHLESFRYWCDAVDPLSGIPLFGAPGDETWNEVQAAQELLGYATSDHGVCPVVLHPVHGAASYPATLLTDAPITALNKAMAAVSRVAAERHLQPSPLPHLPASVLLLHDVTYSTAGRLLCVERLSIGIPAGSALLLEGPSGSGKSTLLRILGGLYPIDAGCIQLPPRDKVVLLPQRSVIAPGNTLADQLAYGSSCHCTPSAMNEVLHAVGLSHLLHRVGGNLHQVADWAGQLSVGEGQRLAIARLLLQRPVLAVLDEATSALGDAAALDLCRLIRGTGAAVLTLSQCQSPLREVHDAVITIRGQQGSWRWVVPARQGTC